MNSIIVVAKNQEKRTEYIQSFCKKNSISPFDQQSISSEAPSIGIELIRDMQKGVYFKPLKGEKKSISIENAQTLTPEAQNALLKILEEPPTHTYIFLSAITSNAFLPTILSRCKVVFLDETQEEMTPESKEEFLSNFTHLAEHNVPFALSLAEKLSADKEKAKEWIETMTILLHEKMLENPQEREVASFLVKLQQVYKMLSTNVNLRLLLEHTFLSM